MLSLGNQGADSDPRNGDYTPRWIRRKRKSPNGKRKERLTLGQNFGTTPSATRALGCRHLAAVLGLTFGTPKALISGPFEFVPKLTPSETSIRRNPYYDGLVPTALVLSAGGMFAAWEAGFWRVLSRQWKPDLVVGASAGAWNGWAIAGGCSPDELIENWLDARTGGIMRLGLHPTGILRPEVLHDEARRLFGRFRPQIDFALTMVEVPRLRVRIVRGPEVGWEHLAASCTIPCAFPPVRINGRSYVDGGLLGALPVWVAETLGATRAIALNVLTTLPFRLLHRALPVRHPSAALEVVTLEPSTPLGSLKDSVCWSRETVARMIEQGGRDATLALPSITM
jgi:predicted acylesterase/phospholipase RssA